MGWWFRRNRPGPAGVPIPVADERTQIDRARSGDAQAFAALLREHEHVAFRVACAITGSAADAEEACQDAFVKCWHALPRFRDGAPFRPWLLTVVGNEARTRRRAAGRRAAWTLRLAAEPQPVPPAGPEAAVLVAERSRELTAALDDLPAVHREVLLLRHVLGLSEAETAAVLDCRPGTVKSRSARALDALREVVQR